MTLLDVQINMIADSRLKKLTAKEKIELILENVVDGHIVVLERGLDPFEEARLIESTMQHIRSDVFCGIEIQSCPHEGKKTVLDKLMMRDSKRMTVIGPADRLKAVCKEKDIISAVIS